MAKSYSYDLREKVAAFVDRGHSCREAARVFGVSVSFVVKLMAKRRATGSLAASPRGGTLGKLHAHRDFLVEAVAAKPDQTMPELAAWLLAERGVEAAPATLSRLLIRCGLTRKKRRSLQPSSSGRTSLPSAGSGSRAVGRACVPSPGG
jgi:transposase